MISWQEGRWIGYRDYIYIYNREGGWREEWIEDRDKTKIGYEPYLITECRSDVAKSFACRVFWATSGRGGMQAPSSAGLVIANGSLRPL